MRTRSCACAHTYILTGLIALYNNPPSRQSAAPPPFKKGGKRVEMSPPPWEMGIYTNPPYILSPLCKGHPTSCPPFDKGGYPTTLSPMQKRVPHILSPLCKGELKGVRKRAKKGKGVMQQLKQPNNSIDKKIYRLCLIQT